MVLNGIAADNGTAHCTRKTRVKRCVTFRAQHGYVFVSVSVIRDLEDGHGYEHIMSVCSLPYP